MNNIFYPDIYTDIEIDISNFSSATYLVKLSTEKGSQTVKVIKK